MGISFLLIILGIISTLFFTNYSQKAYWSNSYWVKHTHEVLDTTYKISQTLIEIQNNNYQNILQKDSDVLQLNTFIEKNLFLKIDKLKNLTSDNLIQQPKIDSLYNKVIKLLHFYKINFDWSKKNLNILYVIRTENTQMIEVKSIIKSIEQEEERLLIVRQKKNDNYTDKLNISFCILLGGIFILLMVLYFNRQNTQEKVDDFIFKEKDYKTELKEQELLQIVTDKAYNTELSQYNYVMSHDLKEPLRMISGFMDLLKKGYTKQLDEKANNYINYAIDGAKRMQKMINDMLRYASVGDNNKALEKINFALLVEEVQLNLYNQIVEAKTKIEIENPDCDVIVYKAEMLRLLQNLISNAIKFRKININSKINIKCTEHKNYWQICIKDNGIGINKIYHEKIFEIFSRLHTDKEYDGTGIGLAISRKIVEHHKGKIWVDSEPDKGCIFYFTISKEL